MRIFRSNFAPVIQEYLEHRKTLGYSNHQEYFLARFDIYCSQHFPDAEALTKRIVRSWFSHEISLGGKGMHGKISAVRMLAQYIGGEAYVLPKTAISPPPKYVPYILTDDELSRLFSAVDTLNGKFETAIKLMFPAMLRLQYTCGLRPPEIRLIKRDDINLATGEILITKTKTNKERLIIMSDDMLKLCRKYDVIRAVANPQSEYFFARADGTPIPPHQFTTTFKSCWKQANPDVPGNMLPRLRPYDLRHRFASAILQKWLNEKRDFYAMLPYLRAFMGHEKFSQTAYYIHLLPENLLSSAGVDWNMMDDVNPEVSVWEN